MLKAIPIELKEANKYVDDFHRHHNHVYRDKFRVACLDTEKNKICGIAQVARPVSRILDDGRTVEVVRLCTDGTANACSFLYSRCARIAKEMGYERIITYILKSENGASLKASGFTKEANSKGGSWSRPSRKRIDKAPTEPKQRWGKVL